MKTIQIENSSAICEIQIKEDENIVGVAYTSNPDKVYDFYCETLNETQEKIFETYEKGESVGKLIHTLRKDGILEALPTKD